MKILAIDDNQNNLTLLKATLSENLPDAQIQVALGGLNGLALARANDPDVILLDILMPDMDGYAVCRKVKEDAALKSIPVLFLTALRTDRVSRQRALDAGAEGFLSKPIDELELVSQIRVMAKVKAAAVAQQTENERLSALVSERTLALQKSKISTLNLLEDLKIENEARKTSEFKLQESEQRFQQVFDSMAEGMAVYQEVDDGRDFIIVDINEPGQIIDTVLKSQVLGKRVTEVYPAIEKMGLLDVFRRVNRTGQPERQPLAQYADGRIEQWVENYVYKLPSGMIATIYADTSAQHRAEESLRKSEEQYRMLAENMSDTVWLMDLDLHILYISPSVIKMRGYSLDEINTLPLSQQMTTDSFQRSMALFAKALSPGNLESSTPQMTFTLDQEFFSKDGSCFWSENTYTLICDQQGHPINILGSGRDITERKQAEELLRKSEEQYRMLAENMSDTVWLFDMNVNTVYISPSVTKIHGYTLAEIDAVPLDQLMTADSIQRATTLYEHILATINLGKADTILTQSIELEFRRKDGTYFWSEFSFTLIRDQAGQPINILGSGRDITERKQAEEAVAHETALLNQAEANARMGSWRIDLATGKLSLSDEMYIITGLDRSMGSHPLGDVVSTLTHPEHTVKLAGLFTDIMQERSPQQVEYQIKKPGGEVQWFHVQGGLEYDKFGQESALVGFSLDITERKKAEEEINSLARFVSENPDAVLRVASDGTLLYVNPHGLIQLPRWQLHMGDHVPSIVHDIVRECLESGSALAIDLEHGEKIFSFLAVAVNEAGYVNLYGHDVTKRRQSEAALRQQSEEIRARNEELDRFNRAAVGRELRMVELKREVNELCARLGKPPIYRVADEGATKPPSTMV